MQYILPSLLLLGSSLQCAEQEEIAVLEQLVETTKKNLENQQKILTLVRSYHAARQAYLADPDSSKLATTLVKRAIAVQELIEKEHLSHLFDSNFLTEVAFYYQVGKQQLGRN